MSPESSPNPGMAERIRVFDWAATSLGPRDGWSQRLQVMVEQVLASPLVASLVCGPDRLLIYNDSAARLFGDQHPAALGLPLPATFPAGWATVAPFYERAFAGEVVTISDQPLDSRGEGASTEVFDALLMPVMEADGHVAHVHMTGSDIAGRQRAEATMRDSKQRLRLMLDNLAQATWETDGAGVVTIDSPSWRAYTGQSLEEWLGYGWLDAIHVDDRAYAEHQWREAMAERRHVNAEFRLRSPDGGWRWTNVRAVPSFDDKGNVHKWLGVNIDIDARKQAERRQAFLLGLSDALRSQSDAQAAAQTVVDMVADHMALDRCYLATMSSAADLGWVEQEYRRPDLPSIIGEHCYADALEVMQCTGEAPVIVADTAMEASFTDEEKQKFLVMGIGALLCVPRRRANSDVIWAFSVSTMKSRKWTDAECWLVEEVAERTWTAIERMRVELALRESEARLVAAFDSVPVGIAVVDKMGQVMFSNAQYQRFVPTRFIPSRDPERSGRWQAWNSEGRLLQPEEFPGARSLRGERVVPGQEMLFTDDAGVETWASTATVPIRDLSGQVTGMVSVISDIDTEKRNVVALQESEERLRQFGEASQDVLWIRDVDTLQWQYLSPAFETVYGLSREEALAGNNYRNWQDLILPEDRANAVDSIARVARGEQVVFEYRIRRPADDQVRWMRDTDFPMGGDDGKALRIGGVGHDITALKHTEAALATAEQRQRLLLEGMPQLVWRAVDEGRWTWASPQWIAHTGLSNQASKDYGWLDALHPDDRDVARAAWAQAPSAGIFQVECRIRNGKTGLYHWFQTRGTPIRRDDGSVAEWLGTSTDIDEQVRAREYLRRAGIDLEQRVEERTAELQQALDTLHREVGEHEQAEERLRQSEKLKAVGQLTGGIAHDFNNMLQGVTSALALVQVRLGQGRVEAAQEYIEPAHKAAMRAGALTHRLLAFSRQQALSPRPVNLERIARDMEDMVRRTVGPAVQVELKSSNGQWFVLCDPNQMESALLNLCINARDAMPSGGWLTIGLEDRMLSAAELAGFEELIPGRFVMLSVTDTGTGMPKEVVARAFEPFFTTKPLGQGTGLGLSQIYGFIRQSGGLVQIETAPGKGTTVRMGLPVHEAVPEAVSGVTKNGKTLLLVEDENDLRRMLAVQLRDLGYGVLEADTADAALRVLKTGTHVDLLVTDVGLRGGRDGRELAEAARMDIPNLPVIFVTGFPGENFGGAGRVLQKPFKFSMLALLIQEQIG